MYRFIAISAALSAALFATPGVAGISAPLPQEGQQGLAQQEKELTRAVQALQDRLVNERTKLLQDIAVNGEQLDPEEVLREAVYLTGGKLVEAKVADFFIIEQMEVAIEGGRDPNDFVVTDDDVMKDLEESMLEFTTQNPGIEYWEVVRSQYGLNKETFIHQRKQAMLFDRVFFPGAPKDWPLITKESIMAQTKGQEGAQFIEQLEKATEGVDENGNPKELPPFWLNMLRQFVQKGLRNWSDIQYGSSGLAADVVVSVNGRTWSTEDAFAFVKQGLYVQDLQNALSEVVVRAAIKQELEKAGFHLSNEEFTEKFDEYRAPYDETPFNIEVIAVRFKGYPCLEAFRARWRLIRSFEDMIAEDINNENLQAHADKFAAFFADGQVSIDYIPFMARNTQTGAWQPDGLAQARERAMAVFADLESEKVTFDEALAEHGEFFSNDENKGRLGFKPLNQIRQQLRENEFNELLQGYSLSHFLFYDAEVGKAVGPLEGPDAYYIARVNSRTPPRRKLNVENERERELVKEDYVNYRFMQWANTVVERARVEAGGSLKSAIAGMIALLEEKDYATLLQTYVSPEELEKLLGDGDIAVLAKDFGSGSKPQKLLDFLKVAMDLDPEWSEAGDEAVFSGEQFPQSLEFVRVGKKWYLQDK